MYPFLESIRISNGIIQLASLHESRMLRTLRHFGNSTFVPVLSYVISIPPEFRNGEVKCRLLYSAEGEYRYEFAFYTPRLHKRIAIVEVPGAEYSFKYSNRTMFTRLLAAYPGYDDVIITVNGYLTDASYANIILELNGEYVTPAQPLLHGVQRNRLLAEKKITEAPLVPADLFRASCVRYINAMLPPELSPGYSPDIFELVK